MTQPSRQALAIAAACLLGLAAGPTGCGDPTPPAAPSARDGEKKPPPEQATYPIRYLFIEARDTPRSPTRPARTREQALALAQETVRRLRAPGADFVAIAREVSDDLVANESEGFRGFVSFWAPGDAEEVIEAASKLAVGGVSDPVPSPRGFHVVQRLSRDEGRAIEARVVVPMEGLLLRWAELEPNAEPRRSKAEAYAEAAAVAARLREGAEVERVLPDLQTFKTFALPLRRREIAGWDAFVEASFASKPGDWVGPVETPDGWAVGRRLPYVRAGVRHLVVTHRQSPGPSKRDRSPEEAEALAIRALELLKADPSSWNAVVEKFSDEPGSRAVGGYLGDYATTADPSRRMAPEIEAELRQMAPGARSTEVVASRFGFHVFWRLD